MSVVESLQPCRHWSWGSGYWGDHCLSEVRFASHGVLIPQTAQERPSVILKGPVLGNSRNEAGGLIKHPVLQHLNTLMGSCP